MIAFKRHEPGVYHVVATVGGRRIVITTVTRHEWTEPVASTSWHYTQGGREYEVSTLAEAREDVAAGLVAAWESSTK